MDFGELHIFGQAEMDRMVQALNMPLSPRYITFPEPEMNRLSAYCRAFDEYEQKILELTGARLDEVLLSKYYWRARMEALSGHRADFAQYAYQAIEELDQRLEDVDWSLVEQLDKEIEQEHE